MSQNNSEANRTTGSSMVQDIPMNAGLSATTLNAALQNGVVNRWLSPDVIINIESLTRKLRDGEGLLNTYLVSNFSESGRELLAKSVDPTTNWAQLKQVLVQELNRVIAGGLIYEQARFVSVTLRKNTRHLLKIKPRGPALVRLNRFLIEDAFPLELSRTPGRGKNQIQKPATVHHFRKTEKWGVLVTLVEPRTLEGKMRSGRQKFERQTEELANDLCVEINNQLFDKKLARELSQHEIDLAKKLFWEILEPKHRDWFEHLDKLIEHCENSDFHLDSKAIPTIEEAARLFWKEYLCGMQDETKMAYRNALAFLLPLFRHYKAFEVTDKQILTLAYGKETLRFLKSNIVRRLTPAEAENRLWNTPMQSKSKRPWSHQMLTRFLKCTRVFKNWMHHSKDPATQQKRNWCPPSQIELPDKPHAATGSTMPGTDNMNTMLDEECRRNPALTIPQVQALLDVAWVAFDGEFAPFHLHGLFCGSRVKETKKTLPAAFDSNDGVLAVPAKTAKTGRARDSELYSNTIVMVEALRSKGLYTAAGFRPNHQQRTVMHILADFASANKALLHAASLERARLAKKGIALQYYNWNISYPSNALRRTALSMHYKLFVSVPLTTGWAGNSGAVFHEYYKRLVTKEAARQYWVMLPTWLKLRRAITVALPAGHKLDSAMTSEVTSAVSAACEAMHELKKDIAVAEENSALTKAAWKAHLASQRGLSAHK